jgi:adenylate kinase
MNILMLGIQGSGKGTQAEQLEEKLKIGHVSTGEICRNIDITTPLGKKVRSYIDKGMLIPTGLMTELLKERLSKDDCKNGAILEGYPRTTEQAELLDDFFPLDHVILLSISDEEALKRLSGRWTCSNKNCAIAYNVYTEPKPKIPGICDKCGSKLYQRKDETPEAIKKRIETFHKETEPLIDYYRKKGILITINGMPSIEDVQKEIREKLGIS